MHDNVYCLINSERKENNSQGILIYILPFHQYMRDYLHNRMWCKIVVCNTNCCIFKNKCILIRTDERKNTYSPLKQKKKININNVFNHVIHYNLNEWSDVYMG